MGKVRLVAALVIAFSLSACGTGSAGAKPDAAPSTRAAAALVHWSPSVHVPGVLDLTDARSRDGRPTVANAGRLSLLGPGGVLTPYARGSHGYSTNTNEPYIARGTGKAVSGARCKFVRDTIYALEPSLSPGVVAIDTKGRARRFADLPAGLPNGIALDEVGRFGYRLLVTEVANNQTSVFAIDCKGRVTTITSSAPVVEGGVAVAPASFGAFGGDLIAPDELTGIIWAIDPTGNATQVAQSPLLHGPDTGVESAGFVPARFDAGWSAYVADRGTPGNPHPGNDEILRLSGTDLVGAGVQVGDLVVVSEASAQTVVVHCAATCTIREMADGPQTAHIEGHVVITNALH